MNESNIAKCPRCGAAIPPGMPGDLCPRCAAGFLQAPQTEMSGDGGKAHTFDPPSVAELTPLFPQLEIVGLLGRGGMGAVYKARQKELDRFVALKILPPHIGEDAAFAQRFAREAKALARLNHPDIVTIYDFGRVDGLYYFLMEFVDGVNLHRLLEDGRVSPREALAIVPQICDALQYAHDQGIVHRDIKPQNILLDRRGRVKVADFGLAKLVGTGVEGDFGTTTTASEAALTEAGKVVGTPAYMAPEQEARPSEVDHRADIYALGVVFYQLLTGELPRKPLEPPSRKVRIDVRLDEVVLKAMEAAPERRYEQASQLKTAVESITSPAGPETVRQAGELSSGAGIRDSVRKLRAAQPRWWQVFLAGFLTVVLLEFAAFAFTERGIGQLILALVCGGVAVAVFLIARQVWLNALLVGMLIAFLSWLAVVTAATAPALSTPTAPRAYTYAACVGLLGVAAWVMAMRWLRAFRAFFTGFMALFLLVFAASAIITFLMPESFSSTARIGVFHGQSPGPGYLPRQSDARHEEFIQTEASVVRSTLVLNKVIENLDLTRKWSQRAKGEPLSSAETLELLNSRLQVRTVSNADVVEIRVYDPTGDEAAAIANEIAQVFRQTRLAQVAENNAAPMRIAIVDQAMPGLRPVRPNKPLNLTIGALAGLLFGTIGGAAFAGYKARNEGSSR